MDWHLQHPDPMWTSDVMLKALLEEHTLDLNFLLTEVSMLKILV